MELADVLDSKSSGSDTVRVRPPPPAPKKHRARFACPMLFWSGRGSKRKERKCEAFFIKKRNLFCGFSRKTKTPS